MASGVSYVAIVLSIFVSHPSFFRFFVKTSVVSYMAFLLSFLFLVSPSLGS